jgi:septum formation protein
MPGLIQPRPLILASTSPRRAELMKEAGYEFTIVAPTLEEPQESHPTVDAAVYAESLAYFKARSVASKHPDTHILAADTIACLHGEIIGKPADRDDARNILRKLSGTRHEVITGLCLMHSREDRRTLRHDVTIVVVRTLTPEDVEQYLDTDQWRNKAGAYGIQDHGDAFVERIEGSFSNVVGLPLELLAEVFSEWCRA